MTLAFLNIGGQEMILIVIVILILFGGKKLPEIARGLGRGIREFKDASEGIKQEISDQINNFEKDLDVDIDTETPTSNSSTAESTTEAEKENNEETSAGNPNVPEFTSPQGTYQHNPGPGIDGGPQDEYYKYGYNDHFAGEEEEDNIEEAGMDTEADNTPEESGNDENKTSENN